jgi:hypothetical protein
VARQQTEDRITHLKAQLSNPCLADIRREEVRRKIDDLERLIRDYLVEGVVDNDTRVIEDGRDGNELDECNIMSKGKTKRTSRNKVSDTRKVKKLARNVKCHAVETSGST